MHDVAIRTHLQNITGHLATMQRDGRQAADRRQAILADHTYDTGSRGRDARSEALRELADGASQRIDREYRQAADVLTWCADQIRAGSQEWRTPSPAAQAAGDRVRTMLATLKLPHVLAALVADDDQPGLEYAHRSLPALARASAGSRANPETLAAYIRATDERLANARWEDMHHGERTFYELRRAVADAEEALPRERVHWSKVARGTITNADKYEHAFANDPEWRPLIDASAEGPVEAATAGA